MSRKKGATSRRSFIKAAAGVYGGSLLAPRGFAANAQLTRKSWDQEADVVVIGAGATGLPAAIEAKESRASVLLIDANWDVGGHAILSGGNVALGGGTSAQREHGIADSPDILFADLTDWSVVEPNGFPDYRYNDKEIIRVFADNSAQTFDWLVTHGVIFVAKPPDRLGGHATGNSAPRENHAAAMAWRLVETGKPVEAERQATTSSGIGLIRPLEVAARKMGIPILLEHKMTSILRDNRTSGKVVGIEAVSHEKSLRIRAKKAVIIATGGSSGNVNFRRIFDTRLTEEYNGVAGEPYSFQDASGELAAIEIGASLWGAYNQCAEYGLRLTKAGRIGCQYGYANLEWLPTSRVFPLARAIGLRVRDYQDLILVNQAGRRFYDETKGGYTSNNYDSIDSYYPASYRNALDIRYRPQDFLNAALAGTGGASNGGGPIWAIFDSEAVVREGWTVTPPHVDVAEGYFFSGSSIAELATNIRNKHQRESMPADALEKTVARYNSFAEAGQDQDFGKPAPRFKIEKPPFYAAWATPVIHDTRAGLRINSKCQVLDFHGRVIPRLYCGGESAGGFGLHGLARCIVQGRIAGRNAAAEPVSVD